MLFCCRIDGVAGSPMVADIDQQLWQPFNRALDHQQLATDTRVLDF
jgi:hypothetical protein